MPQLSFYVPNTITKAIQHKAKQSGTSVSHYIVELIKNDINQDNKWSAEYFEQVFGQWEGTALERARQGDYFI